MPDEFKKVDAIVIDPPRAGALSQVTEISKTNVGSYSFCLLQPYNICERCSHFM
jgi:23S rRNA (uracil1939-C5)-methyltransferase